MSSPNVLATLGIQWPLFLAQLINFAIVVFVMWKWVYTPLLKLMDKRAAEIADGLKNAADAKLRLADATSEKEKMLRDAKAEARVIVDDAGQKGEVVRAEKLRQTKDEIDKIVSETKTQIKEERDATYDALQGELAGFIVKATEKVVGKLDTKEAHRLINEAISELERA